MTPKEILAADGERRGVSLSKMIGTVNMFLRKGGKLIQEGNTLIMFKNSGDNTAEFHPFHAGSAEEMVKNIIKFAEMLKKLGFEFMTTEYQNERFNSLFKSAKQYETEIVKTQKGYQATVRL